MEKSWKNWKEKLVFFACFITILYCFIAFFPIPRGLVIGLDSWKYALSRLATENVNFGEDIIFTYGPLGYLIRGSVINETFVPILIFRLLVHCALFGLAIFKILNLKSYLQRISFSLSLLFPLLIADEYEALQIEYQCLFIFVIMLSEDSLLEKKYIKWWALGLGAFSGLLALTKLSLGVYAFSSLTALLTVHIFNSIITKSDVMISCFALLNSWLSAVAVSFIFLQPKFGLIIPKLSVIIALIALSIGIAFSVEFILNLNENYQKKIFIINLNKSFLRWLIFYLSYSVALAILILFSSPSLISYVKGSWEILSGYSNAMSIVGSLWELGLAIGEIILIIWLLIKLARGGNLSFAIAIALILNLNFKHGFVRQGGHVIRFFFSVPLLISLCILKSPKEREQKIGYAVHAYALFLAFFHYNLYASYHNPHNLLTGNMLRPLSPAIVATKASFLFNPNDLKSVLEKRNQEILEAVKLPERVLNLVKEREIDIIPWEISLVEKNSLKWKPRPVFQSQAAYTNFLDNINLKSLSAYPRDYIFYNFTAVDGRHPFFDEPATFFQVLCNYQLSEKIPESVNFPSWGNLLLLEKRQSNVCLKNHINKPVQIPWNKYQALEGSDEYLVRAAVKFDYSMLGKICQTLFRVPPVMIEITDRDGIKRTYRILPGNSENGVLISHLPKDELEVRSLFKGILPSPIKSFKFFTSNTLLYKHTIEVNFTSYKML